MITLYAKKKNDDEREITVLGFKFKYKTDKYQKRKPLEYYKNQPSEEKIKKISAQFKKKVGYRLNLENPQSFNEKIQWLKLYYHNPLMTIAADKYLAKDYVAQKIGKEYIIPTLFAWDRVDDIDFDKLPQQFVLKLNSGCGKNIICTDKSSLNISATKEKLNNWLKAANHYCYSYEWAYANIKPKIICEKYIDSLSGDLFDYKFLCYSGRVENMFITSNRKTGLNVTFYDRDFQKLPVIRKYPQSKTPLSKPDEYDKMIELAETLAQDFPFVRVDFYNIGKQIYFGEMTFYPGNGMESFTPREYDYIFGKMLTLPEPMNPEKA